MSEMDPDLLKTLDRFEPISLKEMDEVQLLNRTDTKFVFTIPELLELLKMSNDSYKVLTIDNQRFSEYKTLYFDTPAYDFFLHHHNGKGNRYKVRMRKYLGSDLCFLEVKNKRKGRTIKKRIVIPDFQEELDTEKRNFVNDVIGYPANLTPALWNSFSRITLVSQELKERLTIDVGLSFSSDGKTKNLPSIVIAEVKQERVSRDTPLVANLKQLKIRPTRMSKYCMGCVFLKNQLKHNNFKEKLLMLDKLSKEWK